MEYLIYTNDEQPNDQMKINIVHFINEHNCTKDGNITELSLISLNKLLNTKMILSILIKYGVIIGTILSILFNANNNLLTSYTTFLCIHKQYRNQGFALKLINITKEKCNNYSGYYINHRINNEIKSWYRPINIKHCHSAGFMLYGDKTRQRLMYHVSKPSLIPIKVTIDDYDKVFNRLQKGQLHLSPTFEEYEQLTRCFDIYISNNGLFMLFPMDIFISKSGKKVKNAHLALMIGDVLSEVLWVVSGAGYDLLYGWCAGDVTEEKVNRVRGCITASNMHLSYYNINNNVTNDQMYLPIF